MDLSVCKWKDIKHIREGTREEPDEVIFPIIQGI